MTSTLTEEERVRFSKDIEELKKILFKTLSFFKKNLMLFNNRNTENFTHYFLDIFARFRYNSEGLLALMDSFHNDYRLKICTNLLLRCICSDALTALYLLTFYDKSETDNTSLKNELDLISSEYLHSIKQIIEEENQLLESLKINIFQTIQNKKEWFINLAPELIDTYGKIKNRDQIRATTKPEIKSELKTTGIFLTENEKFQRIKEKGFADYAFIFIAFKYYSQFQHFTLMSKKLIETKLFCDTFYMALTIDHMLMTTDIILQIAKSPNTDFSSELNGIREAINKHFSLQENS
jgi:hypothetical protein